MAKTDYTIKVKVRHTWLLRLCLHAMRILPKSWRIAILEYKPFMGLFTYVEKSNG